MFIVTDLVTLRQILLNFIVSGAFSDEDIIHVEGDVDPSRDLEIIHDELRLKDLEYLAKRMDNLERSVVRGAAKEKKPEYVGTITF